MSELLLNSFIATNFIPMSLMYSNDITIFFMGKCLQKWIIQEVNFKPFTEMSLAPKIKEKEHLKIYDL